MIITIVGVGLIGGSLALGLKDQNFVSHVIGVDNSDLNLNKAIELKIIDEKSDLNRAVKKSDIIIVAIPVNSSIEVIKNILNISDKQIVVDMGSTKENISEAINSHKNRKIFVASHPIAGTENSGPQSAFKTLFNNKVAIRCDKELSDSSKIATVEKMYQTLGMKVVYMDSKAHDVHLAYVSHLSHISSFALGITVLDKEKDESAIFNLAGSGFESTVRLAKSSPEMWNPIFKQNSKNISDALGEYIKQLEKFKYCIDSNQYFESFEMMKNANNIRRVLDGMIKK